MKILNRYSLHVFMYMASLDQFDSGFETEKIASFQFSWWPWRTILTCFFNIAILHQSEICPSLWCDCNFSIELCSVGVQLQTAWATGLAIFVFFINELWKSTETTRSDCQPPKWFKRITVPGALDNIVTDVLLIA